MTLIISITAPDFALIVGDRRLSWNSEVVDENVGKIGAVNFPDGVLLWAYSGIARLGSGRRWDFEVRRWIADLLIESGPPDFQIRNVIARFCKVATESFKKRSDLKRLSASERRLSIIFNGFLTDGTMVSGIVSNFEDGQGGVHNEARADFVDVVITSRAQERKDASLIVVIGQYVSLPTDGLSELNELLLSNAPVIALREKANSLIRVASEAANASNSIGKDIMAGVLYKPAVKGERAVPFTSYSPKAPFQLFPTIEQVSLAPTGSIAVSDLTIRIGDSAGDTLFPKQPRNSRCACGSGQKYKICHGK